MRTYDYIVKENKGVVVCVMSVWNDEYTNSRKFRFSGVAKCSPEDTFSEETGKKIAQRRALLKFKKACIQSNKIWLDSLKRQKAEIDATIAKVTKAIGNMNDTLERIEGEIAVIAR